MKEYKFIKFWFLLLLLPILAYVAGCNLLYPTPDSIEYKGFYDNLSYDSVLDFEIGFYLISYFSKFFLNFTYYQFVVLFLLSGLTCKFFVFTKFKNTLGIFFAYFIFIFYFTEAIAVRAAVAQSIAMLSFCFFEKNRKGTYLLILLASSIHYSCSLYLIPILFYKYFDKYLSRRTLILLIFIFLFISVYIIELLLFIPRFGPYYYANPEYLNIWGVPLTLISLISIIYLFKYKTHFNVVSKLFLYQSALLTSFSLVFFKFSLFSIRLLDLAHILNIILLISLLSKKEKLYLNIILGFYLFYLFFTRIFDGTGFILKILNHA